MKHELWLAAAGLAVTIFAAAVGLGWTLKGDISDVSKEVGDVSKEIQQVMRSHEYALHHGVTMSYQIDDMDVDRLERVDDERFAAMQEQIQLLLQHHGIEYDAPSVSALADMAVDEQKD